VFHIYWLYVYCLKSMSKTSTHVSWWDINQKSSRKELDSYLYNLHKEIIKYRQAITNTLPHVQCTCIKSLNNYLNTSWFYWTYLYLNKNNLMTKELKKSNFRKYNKQIFVRQVTYIIFFTLAVNSNWKFRKMISISK
jgi:hypothetical protein